MKKIFCHRGVSGRPRFVTATKDKGYWWSDEPLSVKIDDSFQFASMLIGRWVELDGERGRIIRPLSTSSRQLKGKYIGGKKWLSRRDMLQFNHFVVIKWRKWKSCKLKTRQPLFKLTFI